VQLALERKQYRSVFLVCIQVLIYHLSARLQTNKQIRFIQQVSTPTVHPCNSKHAPLTPLLDWWYPPRACLYLDHEGLALMQTQTRQQHLAQAAPRCSSITQHIYQAYAHNLASTDIRASKTQLSTLQHRAASTGCLARSELQ
jgi:hypothetical protein